jgi:glycosyltransferase involved in cell wall biosynthesis
VIAVNETIAAHYRRAGFERVEVSYGITDADLFHPPEPARDGDTVNFCVVGDLDRAWKGADTAVAAYREMTAPVRRRSRLHLASFRNPEPTGDDGIVAHEWMPFDRMPGFLRGMDVMLVPSRDEGVMRETFSQAAVQGMLTGLPLIVGNLPVLAEKVAGGGGMIFRDVAELARQMTELASNAELRRRLGETARRTAVGKYVWNTAEFARRHLA